MKRAENRTDPLYVPLAKYLRYQSLWPTAHDSILRMLGSLNCIILTLRKRLIRIQTDLITDDYAFSLAPGGWHYFRALLAEHDAAPHIRPKQSTFFKFFQHEQVRSIRYLNDILFLHDPSKRDRPGQYKFYLGTYPWGDWTRCYVEKGGNPFGYYYDQVEGKMTRDMYGYRKNIWYQPDDEEPLIYEWYRTISLYQAIKKKYSPFLYGAYPSIVLLLRSNGEIRAVRYEGHHRLTILCHLGFPEITTAILPESVEVVREDEVEQWHYVKHRDCPPEQALEIFHAFFELNGRERIEYLGLPPAY